MADGESISKLVIDVEVNDKKALLALNALQQRVKNFNSSNGGKAISDMASNMEKMTRNTAQARREAGQFIEQIKRNNKNLMPTDLYGKSMQQYQKELATAQNKMKQIMSTSAPDKQLKGLERYTIQAQMARNAISQLAKEQQKASGSGLKNFWETDAWKNGTFKSNKPYQGTGAIGSENKPISDATKGLASFQQTAGQTLSNFQKSVDLSGFKDFTATVLKAGQSYSKPYIELEKQITKCETKLENLYTKQELMKNAKPGTERYQKLQTDIKKTEMELDTLNSKMKQLQDTGRDVTSSKKGFDFSKVFSGANKQFSKLSNTITKEFSKLPQKLMKPLLRLGTMFRAMLLRRFIMQVFKSAKEAFDQLAIYSNSIGSEFNKSVSTLVSDFKYLGRTIVAAFEPLVNFAAPIIDFLIQKVVAAINAVNQFINAMFGNSTWTKATYNAENYAESLDKASGSAKKLKQQLQGFDELNNLSSNQGGGGSGASAGGANAGDLFSTQQVSESAKGLAERFKEAWDKADFTDIGKDIGKKITDALNGINWDGIKTTANKIAKSIATFLNGFISPELFGSVGSTIAEALNTAIGSVKTFADNFDWGNLGKSVASSINKFFSTFDFVQAGMTLTSVASGILTAVTDAVQNIKWEDIGSKIVQFISNIDWIKLIAQATTLSYAIGNAVYQLFSGAVAQIAENLSELFSDLGLDSVSGFFKGMADNLETTAQWIRENFQIVIDKVKDFFGIHSPSTVFAGIGGYLIDGLKEGIKNGLSTIGKWVSDTFNTLIDNVKTFLTDGADDSGSSFLTGIKKGISDGATKITDYVKSKVVNPIKKALKAATKIKTKVSVSGASSLTKLKDTWSKLKEMKGTKDFKASFKATGQEVLDKITKVWDKIKSGELKLSVIFNDMFSSRIKSAWNSLANNINKFIDQIPYVGKKIPDVPTFANGAPQGVDHGTMFIAGERGAEIVGNIGNRTEVLNQSQLASTMYSAVLSAMQAANGNGSQPIQVYLDGKVVFDSTRQYAADYTRRTGIPAF